MNLKRYIVFFLIFILFILIVPILIKKKEGLTTTTGIIGKLDIGDTMDGISSHLYSPKLKMRMIFDNGLRIQEVKFKKQIPQIEQGITDTGFFETHIDATDKRLINGSAKSLTFDSTGITLYDKTLNAENDDNPIVINVQSTREPIMITDTRLNLGGYSLFLDDDGNLVAAKPDQYGKYDLTKSYPLLSKGVNRLISYSPEN